MRRTLIFALVITLGLGPLAACGKKAVPTLPEGEKLKVEKRGKKQDVGVTEPNAPAQGGTAAPAPGGTPGGDEAPSPDLSPEGGF